VPPKKGLANPASVLTKSLAPMAPMSLRSSERSATPTQRKLESCVQDPSADVTVSNRVFIDLYALLFHTEPIAGPSKPHSDRVSPAAADNTTVQERPKRTLKRKRSSDSLNLRSAPGPTKKGGSTFQVIPSVLPHDCHCAEIFNSWILGLLRCQSSTFTQWDPVRSMQEERGSLHRAGRSPVRPM
jgi:hypothetical protein